ncbi:glutamate receptor ionotropic, kainate glr-3-like [Metopolophium dirhodum]|uniref:glutamate receptor ionotropic, kainate glr-3-like n=1 Tax=Metopolophium dirhodum TaxID=44670 RepID=UPI00298F6552|nr:glutamate receptor ionotropic, kainate glr-3-like [Metopolophium dirhodum]XP_060866032.1 glutamate receptor ionotropic, kainate glr-3-like [Metopolophium dirhodum]
MLKESTGDILLVPIVVTTTDVQDFDFSIPIFKTWYELYAKYTVNRATSLSYLETWSPEVWAAFLLTMFVIVVCLWLVVKIRHIMPSADDVPVQQVQLQQPSAIESPSLISYFFVVWGSICSQGLHTVNINACSVRVVSWVTLLFGLCISTSYSAVLFSRLTVDKSDLVIPSLDSVARMRTHVLCVRRNSFGYLLFKANETDAAIMDRWLGVVNEPPCPQYEFGDIEVMAKSVCTHQTILVLETPMVMARAMSHQNGCRVMSVAGRHAVAYASVLTAKGSPYTPPINEIMVSLLTNGVVDYLQKKWLSREFRDWTFTEADSIGVTIGHVRGLLVVLGLSVVVAAAVMFAELVTAGANRSVVPVPFRSVDRSNYGQRSSRVTTYGGARW